MHSSVVGLIPAAGLATRLAPLPCSKELYPVGFERDIGSGELRPKAACLHLLEKMRRAGIASVYVVLRKGKWDIPAYLGDGSALGMPLAYLIMGSPYGVPYSLDQAYHFVGSAIVAFGFPDILFSTEDAFEQLLVRQAYSKADMVLGLFPADHPQKCDMIGLASDSRVSTLVINPTQTKLHYTWSIAVWTPPFTRFLHEYLSTRPPPTESDNALHPERSLGEVIGAAVDSGLRVEGVPFSNDACLDIGTPDNLVKAVQRFGELPRTPPTVPSPSR